MLEHIAEEVKDRGMLPLLGIEMHGAREGLGFADGSSLSWFDIKN